jgi:DNA repair exonuclease SbcCD nuclease subunit
MGFAFIHTADWQIGKRFGGLPDDVAARLQEARLDVIGRIAAAARQTGARHVLVAGDVFDSAKPPQRVTGQLLARLAAHRDLVWHLLPGNHDPAQRGAVWDDIARAAPGGHVVLHTTPTPVEIERGVVLLPAPLAAKAMSTDPTAYLDAAVTPRGTIRIGMAHGSVRGFSSLGEAAIPIAPDRAERAQLDYLAIGDWHGMTRINPRSWYSGTPEPDGFKDNDPGYVLAVQIAEAGATPVVSKHATVEYLWRQDTLAIASHAEIDALTEAIRTVAHPASRTLLKLAVTGRLPLAAFAPLELSLEALAATVAHLDVDRVGLATGTAADDLDALGSGAVGVVARELAARNTSEDGAQKAMAERALRILARMAGSAL